MIHQVLIVKNYEHSGDDGRYTRGRAIAAFSEVDLIDSYFHSLVEELDTDNVRFSVLDVEKPPGIKLGERWQRVEKTDLVLHLAGGWCDGKQNAKNTTKVSYSHANSLGLAESLTEDIAQWGSCYVFGHRAAHPRKSRDPLLSVPGSIAVSIEPYALNGPDLQEYLGRGRELGVIIARCISGYLKERGFSIPARSPVSMGVRY